MIQIALWIVSVVVVVWAAVAVLELVGAFVGACCDAVSGDGKSMPGKGIRESERDARAWRAWHDGC